VGLVGPNVLKPEVIHKRLGEGSSKGPSTIGKRTANVMAYYLYCLT
jgi:hypothetical protein